MNHLLRAACVFVLLGIGVVAASARDEQSPVTKSDVFRGREGGYYHVRIPGLVVSNKGTILAYAEARHADAGNVGDWADIDIVLRRSVDDGKSWLPLQILDDGTSFADLPRNKMARRKPGQERHITCNNPVMFVDHEGGVIHLIYCVEYDRCFYSRSTDEGATFLKPVEITSAFEALRPTYDWRVLATGPGHGIQLANGRLVVPIWLSTGEGGGGHRPSCVGTLYSDDHGATWKCGDIVVNHPDLVNPSETVIAELGDRRVMLNIRSENKEHRRAVSISSDGATGWNKPTFDNALYEPVCMASLLRVPKSAGLGDNTLLFCNPVGDKPRGGKSANESKEREKLTMRLSEDGGKTWKASKLLQAGAAGYCDLAAGPDGAIYCLYERGGGRSAMDPEAITCARFDAAWLQSESN